MTRRILIGPFNRVEGDLEVQLDVDGGRVRSARVIAGLYRGFEQILQGREPFDALVFAPRICGICSISQSAAAAAALADAMGLRAPINGRLAMHCMQAAEIVADHLSHFYLFFMPDFARTAYSGRPWYAMAVARFRALEGSAARDFLPARAALLHTMGLLAGKWPHSHAFQPGGTTRPVSATEARRLYRMLREFRGFLEQTVFGDALEAVAALSDGGALMAWAQGRAADFARFLAIAEDLRLEELGRSHDRFLSFGAYESARGGAPLFPGGLWESGAARPLDVGAIAEDVRHAWYAESAAPQPPARGAAVPLPDKPGAYTWCKAPRIGGAPAETGALARQLIAGHPLARDLVARAGGNVRSRVVARLIEVARVVPEMEAWVRGFVPDEPFCAFGDLPGDAEGVGLVEAARGSLGHWLGVRRGRIHNYQIVAPTTWNFSPIDEAGIPGPVERALVGTPIEEGDAGSDGVQVAVQHVVRSFDPCMVCTVH